jgi:uncharacterized protein
MVESDDGSAPRASLAHANWRRRASKAMCVPQTTRILCPFDPILRDRTRAKRLFNFDYRFEGFVPKAKRRHGYYVMVILEGDRLVGRFDPKFDRASGRFMVRNVQWQPGVKPTRTRLREMEESIHQLAAWHGASDVTVT